MLDPCPHRDFLLRPNSVFESSLEIRPLETNLNRIRKGEEETLGSDRRRRKNEALRYMMIEEKQFASNTKAGTTTTSTIRQSMSTSGSAGSTLCLNAPTTPARDNTFIRLNNLNIEDHSVRGHNSIVLGKKKKRGQSAVGGDKSGNGLRQFSLKVCEKVNSKGRTTYNEVADELVSEFASPTISLQPPQDQHQYEKNIRRRVYDALNVLRAMEIITKDKKEIQWKGLYEASAADVEELEAERAAVISRIEKKAAYLKELKEQSVGFENLIQRNTELHGSKSIPKGAVSLPFVLVQTRPQATIEVEMSEDMQLVHFDFNGTPFELHDDNYVVQAMGLGRTTHDVDD